MAKNVTITFKNISGKNETGSFDVIDTEGMSDHEIIMNGADFEYIDTSDWNDGDEDHEIYTRAALEAGVKNGGAFLVRFN